MRSLAEPLRRAKVLVFDFDGTLVDSNPIKHRAFEICFERFPEQRKRILEYCCGNPHVTRDLKFRHVVEQILRLPYTARIETHLHRRFGALTTRQIIRAPALSGAEEFLRAWFPRKRLALLSSTPQRPIEKILEGRKWRSYFHIVRGAPVDKADWLKELIRDELSGDPDRVLFFGDTPDDRESARSAGCPFVGVREPALRGRSTYFLSDFSEELAHAA